MNDVDDTHYLGRGPRQVPPSLHGVYSLLTGTSLPYLPAPTQGRGPFYDLTPPTGVEFRQNSFPESCLTCRRGQGSDDPTRRHPLWEL